MARRRQFLSRLNQVRRHCATIGLTVEGWWAPAGGAFSLPVRCLVRLFRDRGLDTVLGQPSALGLGRVAFVRLRLMIFCL